MRSRKVFISYRRRDAAGEANSLYQFLASRFGADRFFFDIDGIDATADFFATLKAALGETALLVVVIGPDWAAADPETGLRRIDAPDDVVAFEIKTALANGVPILPVLVDGAEMPSPESLPDQIADLSRRQALAVRHAYFKTDMAPVAAVVREHVAPRPWAAVALGAVAVAAIAGAVATGVALEAWRMLTMANPARLADGERFQECGACPVMTILPAGSFEMGSPDGEDGRDADEGPVRTVSITRLAVAVDETTIGQLAACVDDGYCRANAAFSAIRQSGDDLPVTGVSWLDVAGEAGFIDWLNSKTVGAPYRLPSEAEWEYAARAGTATAYFFGDDADQGCTYANLPDAAAKARQPDWITVACDDGWFRHAPVDAVQPNAFGLRHVHGNAREWVGDCWNESHADAPADGRSRRSGNCARAVLRGGGYSDKPHAARSAYRYHKPRDDRSATAGFRVARTLEP